jgi:hypothetical protein
MFFNKKNLHELHRILFFVAAVRKFSHKKKTPFIILFAQKLVSIEISVKPGKDSTSTLSLVSTQGEIKKIPAKNTLSFKGEVKLR